MFASARLKLTLWYLTSILCISVFFSAVIYHVLTLEVARFERIQRFRIERRLQDSTISTIRRPMPAPPQIDTQLLAETRQRIFLMLVLVNLGIAGASGFFGYILSGRTLKPIRDMMDEQDRFVSDASHEFRTPLASLLTSFEVFLRGEKRTLPEAETLITESIGEVLRLQSLSQSLLTLGRNQQGSAESVWQDVGARDAISAAKNAVVQLAKEKHIRILEKGIDATIHGEHDSLVQLLVILLDNAIKFSKDGTTITISSHKKDPYVVLSIKDHGVGMTDEEMRHIFERFYQADPARSRKSGGGYGLGLSIAKNIVTRHHGSITVKSIVNKGSEFIVLLPIHKI